MERIKQKVNKIYNISNIFYSRKILNLLNYELFYAFIRALQIDTTTATLHEPECLQALKRTR
jgi:hypothetical protein